MATWHQQQAGRVRLYHETEWTVVSDPPGGLQTSMSFTREADARAFAEREKTVWGRPHTYVLRPAR